MANKENVQKWVDALRSGEFEQTRQSLHLTKPYERKTETLPVGHCCLGVACEISDEGVIRERKVTSCGVETYNGQGGLLPNAVRNWLGFSTNSPAVKLPSGQWKSLIRLNDEGMDFQEISDLIQKTYL